MANSIPIKYHGETLCCFDQTEVKAVEPYPYYKLASRNLFQRISDWCYSFFTGKKCQDAIESVDICTKILFKDGTWIKIKMPFMEFVDEYW